MIQNEPNNPQVDKLRVLNKLESDQNLVLKYHWPHKTTHYAKKKKRFGENQWATRPRRSANTTAIIDELITEIHILLCISLIKLQNDAAVCFDRTIQNLSTLCSRLHMSQTQYVSSKLTLTKKYNIKYELYMKYHPNIQ